MRVSSPNGTIPSVWDQPNDVFDYVQLVANFDAIDVALALPRTSNAITQAAVLTAGLNNTTDRGRLIYLTAPDGGFVTGTIARWSGTAWTDIKGVELQASLPVTNNFDGRMVLLTAAAGGFAAWTLVRYLTAVWYQVNQGVELAAAYPPTGTNFAGRTVMLTSAGGGFLAYSLIRYNGSTWALVGPQPVPPSTELVYTTQAVDVANSNTVSPGDTLATFGATTFENVKHFVEIALPVVSNTVANAQINFLLREAGATVGTIMSVYGGTTVTDKRNFFVRMPFTPTAASHTYTVTWYLTAAGTATIHATSLTPATVRVIKA